ncbi:hypothetical protein [Streptacidiphilus fuscans]|uniref:Uncharacterized protein n=1 Tax=Streptacidiphilus fuscans TaxID=2789292 RepID=A0A931B4B9_9ACTN|nr:hypothetical protein [Streptacidiphilus fuscans]MBF9070889.1 hypothetical protein [Streptacidiphilus fuscans]
MPWGERPRWARWVSVIWIVGFVEGTGAHLLDLISGGLHAYHAWPLPSQVLFHALLVVDLLVAVLVARGLPSGPPLGAAVMVTDLTANYQGNWSGLLHEPLAYVGVTGLLPMTLFGLFVVGTALPLGRAFRGIVRPV